MKNKKIKPIPVIRNAAGRGLAVFSAVFLAACGEKEREPEPENTTEEITASENISEPEPEISTEDIPEDEILVVFREMNLADYTIDRGFFIDTAGNVYGYDLSKADDCNIYTDIADLHDKLQLIRENAVQKFNVGEDAVLDLYRLGESIDPTAEIVRKQVAYDAGTEALYYYDADTGEMVKCGAIGDYTETSEDFYAGQLWDYYFEKLAINNVPTVEIYTKDDVAMESIHCGYMDGLEGRYIMSNAEDLRAFAVRSGIACDQILDQVAVPDMFMYLLEIRNVNSTGYDLQADAILTNNGITEFVLSPDSVMPEPGAVAGAAMDGFCFVTAYPFCGETGNDWTWSWDIAWPGDTGRYSFEISDPAQVHDYGKTLVIEDVLLKDADGNVSEPASLVLDYDTAFAPECDTAIFDFYEDRDKPIDWFWRCLRFSPEQYETMGKPLNGVYDVDVTAGHIDAIYDAYWWD